MRTLVYKRTHSGDPDPATGVFGNNNCMRQIRGWSFDAAIGVGGIGLEPRQEGIAWKLTWVGIGRHEIAQRHEPPKLVFERFLYFGKEGPLLDQIAPDLAKRIYGGRVRLIMDGCLNARECSDVKEILRLAENAQPSRQLKFAPQRSSQGCGNKRRSDSCR